MYSPNHFAVFLFKCLIQIIRTFLFVFYFVYFNGLNLKFGRLIFFRFPDLLNLFRLLRSDISNLLRRLVLSFDLGPENIVLKSQEWTLVAIILLKL